MRKWLSRQAHNLKFVGSNPTSALSESPSKILHPFLKQTPMVHTLKKNQEIPLNQNTTLPPMINALASGGHVGHKSIPLARARFWHPLMAEAITGIRYGVAILDPLHTRQALLRGFYILAGVLQRGGHVLVVDTRPEFARLGENLSGHEVRGISLANSPQISFCFYKWIGGTLTNWRQVSRSVLTFAKFTERCGSFLADHAMDFPKYRSIKKCFQGFLTRRHNVQGTGKAQGTNVLGKAQGSLFLAFRARPDLIVVLNPNENRTLLREAALLHIPVIALVESNTDLTGIGYPIPTNAASISWVYYCLKKILALVSQVPQSQRRGPRFNERGASIS